MKIQEENAMERLIFISLFSLFLGLMLLITDYWLNKKLIKGYIKKHCERYSITIFKREVCLSIYHPNNICYFRVVLVGLAMTIYSYSYKDFGIALYILSAILDAVDGIVARKCELITKWGEVLDPMCDKLTYLAPIIYFAYQGYMLLYLVFIFLALETIGQFFARWVLDYFNLPLAANNFGKIKAVMCFILVPYCFLLDSGLRIPNFSSHLIAVCCFLSINSLVFKMIPNRYYANILSALNLICGIVGCWFIWQGFLMLAAIAVMAGQVFDLFDGRVAEKYGSTKLGPWMDDLGDSISFGVCPALMIVFSNEIGAFSVFLGVLFASAIIFRLLRFILIDKKRNDLPPNTFSGLPSPAGAAIILGACLVLRNYFIFGFIVIATSFLTVSQFHFSHLGRVIIREIPRPILVISGAIIFTVAAYLIKYKSPEILGWFLLFGSFSYIILGGTITEERIAESK